jgi:hypothetical protein
VFHAKSIPQDWHALVDSLGLPRANAKMLGGMPQPIDYATAGTKPDPAATINNRALDSLVVFDDFRSCFSSAEQPRLPASVLRRN